MDNGRGDMPMAYIVNDEQGSTVEGPCNWRIGAWINAGKPRLVIDASIHGETPFLDLIQPPEMIIRWPTETDAPDPKVTEILRSSVQEHVAAVPKLTLMS